MKRPRWQVLLGFGLLALSAATYGSSWLIFRDTRDVGFYLLQDLGFLPIQVLIVTLIVDGFMRSRTKQIMLRKMNMVIGAFFSEAGVELVRRFGGFNRDIARLRGGLAVAPGWSDRDFASAAARQGAFDFELALAAGDLSGLKAMLLSRREFFLRLLENPNLLEHDTFTDLLWAVFHLTEELACRPDLGALSTADTKHIEADMKRAYALLVAEWIAYMRHLRRDYPYLYSLAVRMNPFNPDARAEVS